MNRPWLTRRAALGTLAVACGGVARWAIWPHEESPIGEAEAQPMNKRRAVPRPQIEQAIKRLQPLALRKTPGDWMQAHPEKNQTFAQYVVDQPTPPAWRYQTLYVQPLEETDKAYDQILLATRDYLQRLFGAPVKQLNVLPESAIPATARREHPTGGQRQILSIYVLNEVLAPQRPKDALAVLGLTTTDLWPGEGWNFVFGQASLSQRVGVWSLARYGDPAESEAARKLCLLRTLKVAGHETGHMFGLRHCTLNECGMNGSNHQEEMDEIPLGFCPQCAAKLWWATDRDPVEWHRSLIEFAEEHSLEVEAELWRQGLKLLEKSP